MKISIITLQNVTNYGSVLQTFATQSFFTNLGYDVEFIDYTRLNQQKKFFKKSLIDKSNIFSFAKSFFKTYILELFVRRKKHISFDMFLKENIKITKNKYFDFASLKKNIPHADIYCTGSDQMWNSKWNGGVEKAYYLDFVEDKPKISFATSIGMENIPNDEIEETIRLLNKYNFITVREFSAVQLLKQYSIESKCILDPTLMMTKKFWQTFCSNVNVPGKITKNYILVYKLNNSHDGIDFDNYVDYVSKKTNMATKVISYGYTFKKKFDDYVCLPTISEFVALFKSASYIITDSFHGTAFSIIFNKNFSVIYPPKYKSRLKNILNITHLDNRVFDGKNYDISNSIINYEYVDENIDKFRTDSSQYIESKMKEIQNNLK